MIYKPGMTTGTQLMKTFMSERYKRMTYVQLKLSWIVASGSTWGARLESRGMAYSREAVAKRASEVEASFNAAIHFMFRPRPWVERLIQCVSKSILARGPPSVHIIAIHIRASAEKAAEVWERQGVKLPSVDDYFELARGISRQLAHPRLLVQTSSPSALRDFARRTDEAGLELSFTNNTRSEHDHWGGWIPSGQMESTVVAAVNLHIASASASVFLSLKMSAWTALVGARGWYGGARHPICCAPNASALSWWRACRRTASLYVYVRRGVALNVTRALALVPANQRRCMVWSRHPNLAAVRLKWELLQAK
jgi:hypothetical protein